MNTRLSSPSSFAGGLHNFCRGVAMAGFGDALGRVPLRLRRLLIREFTRPWVRDRDVMLLARSVHIHDVPAALGLAVPRWRSAQELLL